MKYPILFAILFFQTSSIFSQKLIDEFSFATNFDERPTFMEENSPSFENDNKWIYLGKTANFDEAGFYFYDLKTKERIYKAVPLNEAFSKNTTLFVGNINSKTNRIPLVVHKFLFYSESQGRAGFVVENEDNTRKIKKYFYFGWNLQNNQIETIQFLAEILPESKNAYAQSFQIGSTSEAYYFLFSIDGDLKDKVSEDVQNLLFKVTGSNVEKEFEYNSIYYPYNPTLHPESKTIAIVAYTENYQQLNPKGFLYKLGTQNLESFSIPSVPYGICFSKDGGLLFIASADTGEMRRYNVSNLSQVTKAKWGTHGHRLGFWKEGELVWVRNSGLHVYDPVSLKQKKVIPTKKFYKNHVNVSGSEFLPFQTLLLRNILEDVKGGAAVKILTAD